MNEPEQHDDHHDHPDFLAHHFETPEQQFDSGKLGMWLFLVTEVLFFAGMFCAYAIFRAMRPEVFVFSSQFLNTKLGAINTGVLLFSSLTMAWAVRAAQTEQRKLLTGMLGATLGCAAIFLGVKVIEYTHKWDLGLLPAGFYHYSLTGGHHEEGLSSWMLVLSAPWAIGLLALGAWYGIAKTTRKEFQARIAGPLAVMCLCYFIGIGLGMVLESGSGESLEAPELLTHAQHADTLPQEHTADTGAPRIDTQLAGDMAGPVAGETEVTALDPDAMEDPAVAQMVGEQTNSGIRSELAARERQASVTAAGLASSAPVVDNVLDFDPVEINQKELAGVFFSIYYCMTGVHAIHILGGIGVLIWLLVRSVRADFNRQYFGPVDYVGLYWHLVDLIWIYLFPLLYLIR